MIFTIYCIDIYRARKWIVAEVSENLCVSKDLLYRWFREYRLQNDKHSFPGKTSSIDNEQKQIRNIVRFIKLQFRFRENRRFFWLD